VYDVHHHRCLPDGISVEKMTQKAIETWDREPVFHLSSPKDGWQSKNQRPHHDYIVPSDFPECWHDLDITLEIEAKAKETAVLKLKRSLKL
jgi:UV DNA damage endonuclease